MTSIGAAPRARSWLFAPGDSERKMRKARAQALLVSGGRA